MLRSGATRVAVVGDGPAGATVATLLARGGARVGLFSRGRPEGPLIGESLVPAVVPILRELGVEDEIRSYSVFKPGATFTVGSEESFEIDFDAVHGRVPGYAYNVPRDRFDATVLRACEQAGVRIFHEPGRIEPGSSGAEGSRLRLTDATLAATDGFFGAAQPDWIIDATGRTRTVPRLLDLPTRTGERRDTALFAHLEGVAIDRPGHIHTDRLDHGWCWRIPLPDRVSLGIVADPTVLRTLGDRPEEQYDAVLRGDPQLSKWAGGARRLTRVVKFTNYQLTTDRCTGPGWALVGDCFGFIDPVFSSGLFLAMDGASRLAAAIRVGTPAALSRYEKRHRSHVDAWRQVASYFYDGRFYGMLRLREQPHDNVIGRIINPHASKHLPRVFTGESTNRFYDRFLLDLVMKHALAFDDWERCAIV